jgi:hypothetical protein
MADTFRSLEIYYLLNPNNPDSWASPDLVSAPSSPVAGSSFDAITGLGYLQQVASNYSTLNYTNVWLTNVSATVGTNLVPVLTTNGAVVYVTNPLVSLKFTIAGGSNGLLYDVFATPALTMPPSNGVWSWMGQGYRGVTYTISDLTNESVDLLLGTPYDPNNDGLTVAYERLISHSNPYANSINPAMLNGWAVLWELDPFAIYDQAAFPDAPLARLGYWKFNTSALTNQAGVPPMNTNGVSLATNWSSNAVSLTSSTSELVYPVTTNSTNYFNPGNGTVRFWYRPNWSTIGTSAPNRGSTFGAYFFSAVATNNNSFQFYEWNTTNNTSFITFWSLSNLYTLQGAFNGNNGVPVNFQSNLWYQIVLTYSPTNMALYMNGALLATANTPPQTVATGAPNFGVGYGNVYYPAAGDLGNGFSFGNQKSSSLSVMGQLDELETFDYPLTAQQVAWGFPTFAGNAASNIMSDSNYVGRSDMLQKYVDGTTNLVPCRLGYWRFESTELNGEQGQMPLSYNNIALTPSWSGTALVINPDPASQITYADVGSNGWANVNCRQGSVRFWFKPDVLSGPGHNAPFFYMGSTNSSDEWALWLNSTATSISFITAMNGGGTNIHFNASCGLTNTNWTQIVLTYGSGGSSLYLNGTLATNGSAVTNWPYLTNRNLGFVIGNNMSNNASINGQFEEMETFNYQLAASNILANFQIVTNVDSDLDGIPDYLEDIGLSKPRPFLGHPVVITGTIEAEQFDMGGFGIAYSNTVSNPSSTYRPTGMLISPVTNDTGGGYCLDQMRSNDWAKYTINVLVPQMYMVDVRAQSIGTNTNGVFRCEFSTNSVTYTNTGSLTNSSTNWTDITNVVYLQSGTNVMKLICTNNAPGTNNVGRFNYISIYPYWTNGSPPTNICPISASSLYTTTNSWSAAVSNAAVIQAAVNSLTNGGTVTIPEGTWYVSQASPNDANNAWANAVACITNSNITITGTTTNATNTVLIANNRSTTIFVVGQSHGEAQYQCTNFALSDLTLEAQPHAVATNSGSGYTNIYELGQLALPGSQLEGSLAVFYGWATNRLTCNICISNCVFLRGIKSLVPEQYISNFMVVNCQFIPTDASCLFTGTINTGTSGTTNEATLNTTSWQGADVGIFGDGPLNAVVVGNTYIGNSSLTTMNTNYPSLTNWPAPDGFVWFLSSGNVFVARNIISNYALEAIHLDAGPNAVVGNTIGTLVSDLSCCALNADNGNTIGLTGTNVINFSTSFIGNSVDGGRTGEEGSLSDGPFTINFSGNSLNLYLAFDSTNDYPGAAVNVARCQVANVCGNTLIVGGYGFYYTGTNTSALILNNNFNSATYRGIGYRFGGDSVATAQIFGNTLSEGVSFHVQLPYTNSFGWFVGSNTYVTNITTRAPAFFDPASSAIHVYN